MIEKQLKIAIFLTISCVLNGFLIHCKIAQIKKLASPKKGIICINILHIDKKI